MNKKDVQEIKKKLSQPIVMVGMMGAGKTTLGKNLAQILEIPFTDIDHSIETSEGRSIADIFEKEGESSFRQKELGAIAQALEPQGPCIISVGGGAFIQEEVRTLLQGRTYSLWLKVAPEILYQRIQEGGDRPLLQVENPKRELKQLLQEREFVYAKADLSAEIPADESISESCERVVQLLHGFLVSY